MSSDFDKLFSKTRLPISLIKKMMDKFGFTIIVNNNDTTKSTFSCKCKYCNTTISTKYRDNLEGKMEAFGEEMVYIYLNNNITENIYKFITEMSMHFVDRHIDSFYDINDKTNLDLIRKQSDSVSSVSFEELKNNYNILQKKYTEIEELNKKHASEIEELQKNKSISSISNSDFNTITQEIISKIKDIELRLDNNSTDAVSDIANYSALLVNLSFKITNYDHINTLTDFLSYKRKLENYKKKYNLY
jgi:hypothetical protein